MMKRKATLLMITVMLVTSVFPAGFTAYAEDAVGTSKTAVEAMLDGTFEESLDVSAVAGDLNVSDEEARQAVEDVQAADDELQSDELVAEDIAADEAVQDGPAEEGEQIVPIVADGDLVVSDVEIVDGVAPVVAEDGNRAIESISIRDMKDSYDMSEIGRKLRELVVTVNFEADAPATLNFWNYDEETGNYYQYAGFIEEENDKIILQLKRNMPGNQSVHVNMPQYWDGGLFALLPGQYTLSAFAEDNSSVSLAEKTFEVTYSGTTDALTVPTIDKTLTLDAYGQKLYSFEVPANGGGEYYFFSSTDGGYGDPIVELYDSNSNWLMGDYDGADRMNFSLYYDFKGGETYYFRVLPYDNENDISVKVSLVMKKTVKSLEWIDTAKSYVLNGDGEAYIKSDDFRVKVTYGDGNSYVLNSTDSDKFGNNMWVDVYALKSGNPDRSQPLERTIKNAGMYALFAYINDGVNTIATSTWATITVTDSRHTHSWGPWIVATQGKLIRARTCKTCQISESQAFTPVLTLTASKLTMKTKQSTTKFKVTAMAAGDSLASVTSSSTKLLKVSNVKPNGTFKLKAQNKTGTAKLTITLKSGVSKTIKVKIQAAKVSTTKIKVASRKLTLSKKQKYNLATVVTPVTSYDKVKYTTSNRKVATVSKKGQITAKGKGKATITVKSGKKSVKVKVTVK